MRSRKENSSAKPWVSAGGAQQSAAPDGFPLRSKAAAELGSLSLLM